jgi:hypothetical protein
MLARAWCPLATAIEDEPERVVWMPAHYSRAHIGVKRLGNGETLTALDLEANALVDQLAKEAAGEDRVPAWQRKAVREAGEKLTAVAKWIGQVTVIAGEFPDPECQGVGKQKRVRDTEGRACLAASKGKKRKQPPPTCSAPNPRFEALRRRIAAKELAAKDTPNT